MSPTVRRLRPDELERLDEALVARGALPFTRGYRLPDDGARRWIGRQFGDAASPDEPGDAWIAEADGRLVGGLVVQPVRWEASLYGIPMARVPVAFTTRPHDRPASAAIGRALLGGAQETFESLGARHLSALLMAEDAGLVQALAAAGWILVDSTLDYTWACGRTRPAGADPSVVLRPHVASDVEPLGVLAREAYTHHIQTRYSVDPWLPLQTTGELYGRWFELACQGEFGDVVVVAEIDGRPVGFNTFKLDPTLTEATGVGFAQHGIAAVEPAFRGRAGQPAMLHWLAEWQRERGGAFNRGRVLVNNYAMQRACSKSGGFVTQAFHTFHAWRGPPPETREETAP